MTDVSRHTVCVMPIEDLYARPWERIDRKACPVCGAPALQGQTHADGMPVLRLECRAHTELNPMDFSIEELAGFHPEHVCPFCEGQPMSPDCGVCGGAGTLPDATPPPISTFKNTPEGLARWRSAERRRAPEAYE